MQHKKIILCAFVISGLQVQLLSPAPRKILRYTVKTTACIVGFLLLYALQNARKVRQKCDKSHKTASSATVCAPVLYALPYIIRLYNGRPSQMPPHLAVLHRLRFSLRGMPVQMRGKQAFGVWQYTFITGQRKSAEPAKTRLCAGVICCLVLGAGLDVQQLHNSRIIALVLFKLLA